MTNSKTAKREYNNHEIAGFVGTCDSVDTCDHCGKSHLKHTVVLVTTDGNEVYYGATCAARKLLRPVADVKADARMAEERRKQEAAKAEQERWHAFVLTKVSAVRTNFWQDRIDWYSTQAQYPGGTKALRAAYRESVSP